MTNRQSNIIFYTVISLIIYALIINHTNPDFFENFTKSKKELSVKEAVKNGEHQEALSLYQQIIEERKNNNNENNTESADIYEEMAKLYSSLGNKTQEKSHYLKSLAIKKKLKKTDLFGITHTYDKLGSLAEEEKQYDQAQMYYEKSLLLRLGNHDKEESEGIITGMHESRLKYIKLNNEETIATFKKLGQIHNIKNEHSIAKTYYEKALTASKITFGEGHIKTLEIMELLSQTGVKN